MSDKDKKKNNSEEEDEENASSEGSSTDNKKTDPSQTLDLGAEFCEEAPRNPERMFKEAKAKIRNAPKSYAEVGRWFGEVRRFGLWRCAKRNKYKSFAEFYRDMGYSPDQVCHQIAISKLLTALIEEVGNREVKITVYHGTVLLAGTRNKDVRFQADTDLACEIFRTVLEKNGKVTGKLLREEMVKRGLINPSQRKMPIADRNAPDLEDDDQIDEPVNGEDADEVMDSHGDAGEEASNATSTKDSDGSAAKAVAVAQAVRQELTQARTIASDLLEEAEKSHAHQELRPRLIELRSLLDEIQKQLGD